MILLTGYADKENAIRAINEIGLYKYIEKPWDNTDLMMNIRNGIERSRLMSDLRSKIMQLESAHQRLGEYSQNLEQLVEQRSAQLSGIVNFSADGIVTIDESGMIESVNPAFEHLTGLSCETLVGKSFQNVANSPVEFDSDRQEVLLRDCYVVNALTHAQIPVEVHFALIANSGKYVGVIRNVSVQKETERLRDDFIATLTHDLRTPLLAAVQTLKYMIDGDGLNAQQQVVLTTMLHSNEDLLGLVNALLEVYRFESGKLKLCKTTFPFKELVEQCYNELKPLATHKRQEFELCLDMDDKVHISADRAELKRVITNLCGNAVNYTNDGGHICVLAKVQNGDLIFSVSDNGNGIPKEDIPNLFMRFSQGTARKRSTGTGLGLYLSRQIVEAHGGKIWVESKMDKGSEFSFLLTNAANREVNEHAGVSEVVYG